MTAGGRVEQVEDLKFAGCCKPTCAGTCGLLHSSSACPAVFLLAISLPVCYHAPLTYVGASCEKLTYALCSYYVFSACVPACFLACLLACLPCWLQRCSVCLLPACLPACLPARPPCCLPAWDKPPGRQWQNPPACLPNPKRLRRRSEVMVVEDEQGSRATAKEKLSRLRPRIREMPGIESSSMAPSLQIEGSHDSSGDGCSITKRRPKDPSDPSRREASTVKSKS